MENAKQPKPERVKMSLNAMKVDPRTEQIFNDMGEITMTSKAVRFQQMMIFCLRNGFNALTSAKNWEDGE